MSLVGTWLQFRRLRRQLRKAPAYRLADLPENTLARLEGIARPLSKRALQAPLSGRLCVYYSATVVVHAQPEIRVARSKPFGTRLASEEDAVPFILEDGDARAVIDPRHAVISSAFDFKTTSKAALDATENQRALLERHGLFNRPWYNIDHLSYREAVIELDERIVVLGGGTREPDPDAATAGGYRDGGATRFRLTGTERNPIVISDEPDAFRTRR